MPSKPSRSWSLASLNPFAAATSIRSSSPDTEPSEDDAETAKENVIQLTQQLDSTSKMLKSSQMHNKKLGQELDGANKQADAHAAQVERLSDKIQELRERAENAKQASYAVQLQNQVLDEQLGSTKRDVQYAQSDVHQLKKALQNERQECENLREQAVHFKTLVSTSTHADGQISDDAIRDEFDQLFYGIQDFAVKTFRGVKFEFELLPEDTKNEILPFIPDARKLPKSYWISIATSIITREVVEWLRPANYFGLSKVAHIMAAGELASTIFDANLDDNRKWLVATRKMIAAKEDHSLMQADDRLVRYMMKAVRHALRDAMNTEWRPDAEAQLAKVFTSAQQLYRLLFAQNAEYHVEMVRAKNDDGTEVFQPGWMADVDGIEDDNDLAGRELVVSVFPAILKMVESTSGATDQAVVVAKARVVPRRIVS